METENMNIVIVGHVDHGKSTLIGRLLYDTNSLPEGKIDEIKMICESLGKDIEFGYIMDHLEEERDQGITIDTSQIFFRTEKRRYTIIDAPGHVEFVKNMITGASLADAAVLIVDVTEGMKEQTRRHAYILNMLGLKQVTVVVNKMDMTHYEEYAYQKVVKEMQKFLKEININPIHIIPISAKEGDNMALRSEKMRWYNGLTFLEALDNFVAKEEGKIHPLRFPIQDVYNFDKRINVGVVAEGMIQQGDEILILPSQEKTKVKSIEEWNKIVAQAEKGKSTGFVTETKVFIDRGNVVTKVGEAQPTVTSFFRGHLFWMDKQPFKKRERILLRCATQETLCDMEIEKVIDSSTLELCTGNPDEIRERQVADVIIRTEHPLIIENFSLTPELGRFVLEREEICAGGIISDPGGNIG